MTTLRSVLKKPRHAAGSDGAASFYTDHDLENAHLVIAVYSDGRRRSVTAAHYLAAMETVDVWARRDQRLAIARIYAPQGHGKYQLVQDWER